MGSFEEITLSVTNHNLNANNFEKVDVKKLTSPSVEKSALSFMINEEQKNDDFKETESNASLSIIFTEFGFNTETMIKLLIFDSNMTVEQVMNSAISQFEVAHSAKNLQSYNAADYDLRSIDDDDIDDFDDLDEDDLDPALSRNGKILDFMDCNSPNTAMMAMCLTQQQIIKSVTFESISSNHQISDKQQDSKNLHEQRLRAQTMDEIEQQSKAVFIRVYIPGPMNESSVMLSVEDCNNMILRDLFFLTTRKRKSEKYNAQYFEFYYRT